MNDHQRSIALQCLNGAYNATMDFPQIVQTLAQNGFERYHVDYSRNTATYYLGDGDNVELPTPHRNAPVQEQFSSVVIQAAIKEAQQNMPGYTYISFCKKVTAAGCAGYIVSFLGRRVVYYGRTAEIHVEHFPQ